MFPLWPSASPCNSNAEPADERDMEVAHGAGGQTWAEMRRLKLVDEPALTHYLDEHTNLWIPRGILLFRPWRRRKPARDTMQLEG